MAFFIPVIHRSANNIMKSSLMKRIGAPTLVYDSTKTDLVGDPPTNAQLKVIKGNLLE